MSHAPSMNWDLESTCPGGPTGALFASRLAAATQTWNALAEQAGSFDSLHQDGERWMKWVLAALDAVSPLDELIAITGCWSAENGRSVDARMAMGHTQTIQLVSEKAWLSLDSALATATDDHIEAWWSAPDLRDALHFLKQRREGIRNQLPPALENLAVSLQREATHGWGQLYEVLSGRLSGTLTTDGETRTVGVSELKAMRADPSEQTRRAAHEALEAAWSLAGLPPCLALLTGRLAY